MSRPGDAIEYIRIADAAHLFGVTVQAVHLWIRRGLLGRVRRTSKRGTYLLPRAEVARLLEKKGRRVPGLWEPPKVRVLVVDDSAAIRDLAVVAGRSRAHPLDVRTAATVEDGLLLAGEFRPDVILLDDLFPRDRLRGGEGLAILRHAEATRSVTIVALVDDRRRGLAMMRGGADAVLIKPFDLGEFRAAVSAARVSATSAAR